MSRKDTQKLRRGVTTGTAAATEAALIHAVFFGKTVKRVQGIEHTHARSAALPLKQRAQGTPEITGSSALANRVQDANTARAVFNFIRDDYPEVIHKVAREIVAIALNFCQWTLDVRVAIFDFDGTRCFDSAQGVTA